MMRDRRSCRMLEEVYLLCYIEYIKDIVVSIFFKD